MILNLWADSMITRSILDHSILLPLFYFITSPALINKCSLHLWSLLHQFVYSARFILEYVVNEKLICPCHIFFIPITNTACDWAHRNPGLLGVSEHDPWQSWPASQILHLGRRDTKNIQWGTKPLQCFCICY